MPRMRWRVVCGRGVTNESLCPTRAFRWVDLPTFGRPTRAAKPLRKGASGVFTGAILNAAGGKRLDHALGGLLFGAAAAGTLPLRRKAERPHFAADGETLGVVGAGNLRDRVLRQLQAARLQELLQAGLGVLEGLGGR